MAAEGMHLSSTEMRRLAKLLRIPDGQPEKLLRERIRARIAEGAADVGHI